MAEYQDREHFIPIGRADLIDLLAKEPGLAPEDRDSFLQFCKLINAMFHFQYHESLEELKKQYAPFDPDNNTKIFAPMPEDQRDEALGKLFEKFSWVMEKANYKRLSREELLQATENASEWGINLDIEFDCFSHFDVYVRGDGIGTRYKRAWQKFFRLVPVEVPQYQRIVIILKQQRHKRLGRSADTENVYLKMFKEIPKDDIEMLFPGGRLKMPKTEKMKLGASVIGSIGFVAYKIFTGLAAIIAGGIIGLAGPLGLIGGYGYKQYATYQNSKKNFMQKLTESLYFYNLSSNSGVLFALLDEAEEQECREAILGYYYLWRSAGEHGWTASFLDDHVEKELERLAGIKFDFEIEDALEKLVTLRLVEKTEDRYRAVPIDKALEHLDERWDNFFQYNKVGTESV